MGSIITKIKNKINKVSTDTQYLVILGLLGCVLGGSISVLLNSLSDFNKTMERLKKVTDSVCNYIKIISPMAAIGDREEFLKANEEFRAELEILKRDV